CHTRVLSSTRSADPKLPKMAACMKCHQEDYDRLHCSKCHADLSDPRYGPEVGRFVHKGNWLRNHKLYAQEADAAACAQCHLERFCADCHSGADNQVKVSIKQVRRTDRHFIHRGDWVTRHGLDAARDPQPCLGCHRTSTCSDCHERRGVRYVAGNPTPFGGSHPFGAEIGTAGHGIATHPENRTVIRRNIVACASCHDGKSPVCATCHASVAGSGINPHPPGFRSNFNPKRQPVCRTCHR
ncbi:MAG: hypothetical protein D6739_01380, partial [Nitrospirae bacterium]